jgi:AhpD family alkylhydroperoxidase
MYDAALLKNLRKLGTLAPSAWPAFQAFDKAAMADGAVPVKYKELMAVAVALTTQCIYCVEAHTRRARSAGASDAELGETILVAAALRAGGAIAHGAHCLEDGV